MSVVSFALSPYSASVRVRCRSMGRLQTHLFRYTFTFHITLVRPLASARMVGRCPVMVVNIANSKWLIMMEQFMLDISFCPCLMISSDWVERPYLFQFAPHQQQPHASGYLRFGLQSSCVGTNESEKPTIHMHCVLYNNFLIAQFCEVK